MAVAPRMTLRKPKRAAVDHDAFEEEFALESLKSDRLRVTILIGAIVSSVLLVVVMAQVFFDQFQSVFHGNSRGFLQAVGVRKLWTGFAGFTRFTRFNRVSPVNPVQGLIAS